MTPEHRAALEAEKTMLQAKADARRNQPGFSANVIEIDTRIAAIVAELAAG